jgi:cold shock CspA family protein
MAAASDRGTGTVESFDSHAGLGVVRGDDGAAWPFHCVAIADGSRDIAPGTKVSFTVRFHVARDEAFDIAPVAVHAVD